jgi:hypothetical protein
MGAKNVDGHPQGETMVAAWTFLEHYHKDGDDFLDTL